MAERELSILVRAKGAIQAARDIGKVDSAVGRLGQIGGKAARNLTANMTAIGVVAGGFIASQVGLGIRSLEDLERVTNATEGVLDSMGGASGMTAEGVRKLAEDLEKLTTADDKAIQGGQNMLLTFGNIGEKTFPRASKAMADMAIAMAQGDVEAADFKGTAIQVGKALNDPIRGITALRRVGVQFTKDQEKQIKVLFESGKVAEAQALILEELEREFGKAGEAAGKGFGADMRRAKDAIEDAQMALATGLLPVITRVSQWLQTKLADPATIAFLKDLGEGLADAFDQVLTIADKIPWDAMAQAMQLMGTGAKAALDFFTSLPPWVQTAVLTGWGLNKLTGGALGDLVGELGKGLIKGILGINAGVVNINAGVVNGGGGIPGGGKPGGRGFIPPIAGPLALAALPTLLAGDTPQGKQGDAEFLAMLQRMQASGRGNEKISDTETVAQALDRLTGAADEAADALKLTPAAVLRSNKESKSPGQGKTGTPVPALTPAAIGTAVKNSIAGVERSIRAIRFPTPKVNVSVPVSVNISSRDVSRSQMFSARFRATPV